MTEPSPARQDVERVFLIAFDSAELSLRLASALSKQVAVTLMLPERVSRPHLKWLADEVRFLPFEKPRMRRPLKQLRLMWAIHREIRRLDPDIVHVQKGHSWFNLLLLVSRPRTLVISIHDPTWHAGDRSASRNPQWLMHVGYRRADRVIAHNEQMRVEIVEQCGIPDERIDVIPLIERGDPKAGGVATERPGTVLFFGRIWPYKGLDYLIRAAPLIAETVADVRIVIGGRGEDMARYRELMDEPARFIVHNEFVSIEKQTQLFDEASVVALPYVEATQSGVIPVAYSHGKAVVATDVGGLASQVEHGITGFLVPPRDIESLAERIVELLLDASLRKRFGDAGREKLQREWSAPVVAEQTLDSYRRALRQGGRRVPVPKSLGKGDDDAAEQSTG